MTQTELEQALAEIIERFVLETGGKVTGLRLLPPNPYVPFLMDDGSVVPNDKYRVQAYVPSESLR